MILFGCVFSWMEKTDEALVDLRLPQHLSVGKRAYASNKGVSVVAGSFDQLGYAGGAKVPDGSVGCEAARTTGVLRIPIQLVACFGFVGEIGGVIGERCAVGGSIGNEGIAAVEGDIEPFVAVGDPGVGVFDAFEEVLESRTDGGPEAEGSVDVNPGVVSFCERNELREVVEGADVNVTGLKDDDGGFGRRGFECLAERVFEKAAMRVGLKGRDVLFAKAEQANGADKCAVFLGAGKDADGG